VTDTEATPSSLTDGHVVVSQPEPPVWYKRRGVLVTGAIVVIIAASVIVDLPRQTTATQDTAAQTSLINEINRDVAGCGFAVRESFAIYQDMRTGALTTSDRSQAPKMLRDDQTACSFTNSSIFSLSTVEVPGSPAGKSIGQVVNVATLWATSDALAAIEDIQSLYSNQGGTTTVADLSKQEVALAKDRALAISYVDAADKVLGATLPVPNLPELAHLVGT
jgi:hypothetical protein